MDSFAELLVLRASQARCYLALPFTFNPDERVRIDQVDKTFIDLECTKSACKALFRCVSRTFLASDISSANEEVFMPETHWEEEDMSHTVEFFEALDAYVGYYEDGKFIPQTEYPNRTNLTYGVYGGGIEQANAIFRSVLEADRLARDIFDTLKLFDVRFDGAENAMDISSLLIKFIGGHSPYRKAPSEVRHGMIQRIECRLIILRQAAQRMENLESRVEHHIRLRMRTKETFLWDQPDDSIGFIAKFLTAESAERLMRSCSRFWKNTDIRVRRPHFRIREVCGTVPHDRVVTLNREQMAKGVQKPETRGFMVANRSIHLYVDYCRKELRTTPLGKLPRADGLSNLERDLDDDMFEIPPERTERKPPPPRDPDLERRDPLKFGRTHGAVVALYNRLEGPYPRTDRYEFYRRLPFPSPFIRMRPKLVFADTHDPVKCSLYPGGLRPSQALRRDDMTCCESQMDGVDTLPAYCKVEIPSAHCTSRFNHRLLKIAMDVLLIRNGFETLIITIFTEPFEVVSKPMFVDNASKRKFRPPAAAASSSASGVGGKKKKKQAA